VGVAHAFQEYKLLIFPHFLDGFSYQLDHQVQVEVNGREFKLIELVFGLRLKLDVFSLLGGFEFFA
jgi:hypothetical protein